MSNTNLTQLVNPFVGLRSFEESEDYLFFGRGKQIDELLKKLKNSHFLAVIGSSGSGKSSLVKSGLLPAVYSGFMTVGSNWRVALMQPGEDPIGYLTKKLAAEGTLYGHIDDKEIPHEEIIETSLRRSENGLVQVYKDARLPANENLLIVVDQFEELFRFSKYEKENNLGKSDAMHFVQILLTAAQQKEYPIYVLLTMRADFLGDCAEFRGLPEAINQGQYLVPRMTREEIREAITGPVAVSTATISQRLVTRLLNDINNDTDQLPILQHAMMRTWEAWYKRNQQDTPIDFEDYDKIGTMKSSLSQHADEAFDELTTEKEQQVCEGMFKALTDKAADTRGVRRPRSIADLCLLTGASSAEIIKEVEIFRKPGRTFLMPPPHIPLTDDSIIDISHESLMRVWERLVKWTEEEGRSSELYTRLVNSAELKEQGQRGLLKDPELAIALKWKDGNKPTPKWAEGYKGEFAQAMAYLEASRVEDIAEKKALAKLAEEKMNAEKQAARKKYVNWIIALMAVLLIGASISSYYLNEKTNEAKASASAAKDSAKVAQRQREIANNLTAIAKLNEAKATDSAAVAVNQREIAVRLKKIADVNATTAENSAKEAAKQRDTARQQKEKAEGLKKVATDQSYKTAPSEYARLIREAPTTKKEIQKDTFDYKLVAYCMHLDKLKDLINGTNDGKAIEKFNNLKDRLYYNNDLYEKIYACFETAPLSARDPVFARVTDNNYKANFERRPDKNRLQNKMAAEKPGTDIIAFLENTNDQLSICSTGDNWIYVYDKNTLALKNKIPMGAKVTALSYDHESNIIYFGLESGDIGYIKYNKDKKNQPVFENALGSKITAIQFFNYRDNSFLLAAAQRSKVVVYKLGKEEPFPDKKLLGNSLPEKKLVEITDAKFDESKGKGMVYIKVRSIKTTKEIIYSWNPFTSSVLEEYKKYKKVNDDFLNRKPDIKIY